MYGGTASEMARLINDSGVLGDKTKVTAKTVNSVSFDKIIQAINITQKKLGIAGTSQEEASKTITGSLGATKAAWENLVTSLSDPNADISKNIKNFVDSLVGAADNLLPTINEAIKGVGTLIKEMLPEILTYIPQFMTDSLPELISAATSTVTAIIDAISTNKDLISTSISSIIDQIVTVMTENLPLLMDATLTILYTLVDQITQNAPKILQAVLDTLLLLVNSITDNIDKFIDAAIKIINAIADTLTKPENLKKIIESAVKLVTALVEGISNNFDKLLDVAVKIIDNLIEYLTEPDNIAELIKCAAKLIWALIKGFYKMDIDLITAAGKIIGYIIKGLIQAGSTLGKTIYDLFKSLKDKIFEIDWKKIGEDIVNGIKKGITGAWHWLSDKFTGLVDGLASGAKHILQINSPSKVFKKIGGSIGEGLEQGISSSFNGVHKTLSNSVNKIIGTAKGLNQSLLNKDGESIGQSLLSKTGQGMGGALGSTILDTVGNGMGTSFLNTTGQGMGGAFGFSKEIKGKIVKPESVTSKAASTTYASDVKPVNVYVDIGTFVNNTDRDLDTLVDQIETTVANRIRREGAVYA